MSPIRTYSEAEAFLREFINYEQLAGGSGGFRYDTKAFDLERFRALLAKLGSPQFCAPVFHVAGTKGKGSTCAILAEILRASGYRVGLFTSPHIESFRERIQVNGIPISETDFCDVLDYVARVRLKDRSGTEGGFRTVFELLTASAFLYFSRTQCDVMVVETGLGGRLDATNVFSNPLADKRRYFALTNIITSIGLDHTEILGPTIEKIAWEKAGIIHENSMVIVSPQSCQYGSAEAAHSVSSEDRSKDSSAESFEHWASTIREVITQRAGQVGAVGPYFTEDFLQWSDLEIGEYTYQGSPPARRCQIKLRPGVEDVIPQSGLLDAVRTGLDIRPTLLGGHQELNLAGAIAALLFAAGRGGIQVTPEAVLRGAEHVQWPGRFEVLCSSPPVIVDGAHCELSTHALVQTYCDLWKGRPARIILGVMRDKNLMTIAAALRRKDFAIAKIYTCTPSSPRARSASETAEICAQVLRRPVAAYPTIGDALRAAWSEREKKEAILCFGSLYLVGPARRALRNLLAEDSEQHASSPER
ncbi:MAG: bifunctional folylpolyglutamate synthase/dihydrofolate synthase [Candidatus Hydrogenedentota bacterium]|uniref:tetrahydrofolate synthase n=1 Tax=Sumerlaea chitinivorans TaxID=2250252 RepID=A0A2Z4Y734_SUMC1|nr:Dihydrofolate synthase [Candidatus Sumerlaea chitinivorans]RMH24460.1 MAG: bifunctional folylpolyglutamate synthase/dihydrofolate synthase [Candidatus Hydrogenedentota bacterium]